MSTSQEIRYNINARGANLSKKFPNFKSLLLSNDDIAAFGVLRNHLTPSETFRRCSQHLFRPLISEVSNYMEYTVKEISTPVDLSKSVKISQRPLNVVAVSILRAGESMESCVVERFPTASIGKILIQRDEKTLKPTLYFSKVPKQLAGTNVLLLDPMLATGGSASAAIQQLIDNYGCKEEQIKFCTLVSTELGVERLMTEFPKINLITALVDEGINELGYIVPGLGDFGDRYFNCA